MRALLATVFGFAVVRAILAKPVPPAYTPPRVSAKLRTLTLKPALKTNDVGDLSPQRVLH